MTRLPDTICLFDVDGTLTESRGKIKKPMRNFMQELRKKVLIGVVSGSDLSKICEQLADDESNEPVEDLLDSYDYCFFENGLIAYHNKTEIHKLSILQHIGEEKSQEFINFALQELSKITLPVKRGNFIEYRTGLINVCPIGRSCTQAERDAFVEYDAKHEIRKGLMEKFREKFEKYDLKFSIGGQISMDVYPKGWDKRYCLDKLLENGVTKIHFFGDRTLPGGNDYEIYNDERTIGHCVKNPEDTKEQLIKLFF